MTSVFWVGTESGVAGGLLLAQVLAPARLAKLKDPTLSTETQSPGSQPWVGARGGVFR